MLSDVHDAWAFSRLKQYDGHKWSPYKDREAASMNKKPKPLKDFDENLSIKDLPKNDALFLIERPLDNRLVHYLYKGSLDTHHQNVLFH